VKGKRRPGFWWLFFYGRRRRGFPWLLAGLLTAAVALGLTFAIPGADWTRAVALLTYAQGVDAFRVTDRLSDSDRAVLMGGTLQMLLGMIAPLDRLRDAFQTGKGIPFEAYPPDAWEGMERDMAGLYETQLVSEWLPRVPAVKGLLEGGALAADIGCGRGRAIFALARAFPKARFVGYDVHTPNVEFAQRKAAEAGLADRVRFEAATKALQRAIDLRSVGACEQVGGLQVVGHRRQA